MRGCVSVLVLAALFALGGAWFGGPALAGSLVELGLSGAGFQARSTNVTVRADPPIEVIAGRADRVVIGADGATFTELEATRVDIELVDVDLVARTFVEVEGTLTGVRLRRDDGALPIGRIELSGSATDADAIVTVAGADVESLAEQALNDALGLPIVGAELIEPDLLRVGIAGQGVEARLVVEPGGALALAVPLPGNPRVELVDPDPLDLRSVTVVEGDLVLTGTLNVRALVGG